MVRFKVLLGVLALAALLLASPVRAQFGSIFRESRPVPPADVPNGPPSNNNGQPGYYPSDNQRYYPPRPPANASADEPPPEPLPTPMSLPPEQRPGGGTIQTQPLAPLPSTAPSPVEANAPARPRSTPPGGGKGAVRTLPGLPPGQRQPRGIPQQANTPPQANPSVPPANEVVIEPPPDRISNPSAVFEGLDKITGRTTKFDVGINETVQFGALQVTPKVCYSRPPTDTPQTDAFVEVDEVTLKGKIRRIFTGWMFAASPGLNAVEHPIYDVWLTNCIGGKLPTLAEAPTEEHTRAKPPQARAPAHVPPPRPRQQSPGFLPAIR